MSAIESRTAALGGHVARCENSACGHSSIAYNSCLMGKIRNGELAAGDMSHAASLKHLPGTCILSCLHRCLGICAVAVGPSGPYLDGLAALLERDGYSSATAVRYLRAAAHLGHFVHEQGGTLAQIDLPAFGAHLRACLCPRSKGGRRNHHTVFGAQHFHGFLLAIGVCQPASATPEVQHVKPEVIARFGVWLRKHHGAADPTIRLYTRDAASLMMALGDDLRRWDATDIRNAFMKRPVNPVKAR